MQQIINPDNHVLIPLLAREYTDEICDGDDSKMFCRDAITAAYMIGAEKTLRRVFNVIEFIAIIDGLSMSQAEKLLACIEAIEENPGKRAEERNDISKKL